MPDPQKYPEWFIPDTQPAPVKGAESYPEWFVPDTPKPQEESTFLGRVFRGETPVQQWYNTPIWKPGTSSLEAQRPYLGTPESDEELNQTLPGIGTLRGYYRKFKELEAPYADQLFSPKNLGLTAFGTAAPVLRAGSIAAAEAGKSGAKLWQLARMSNLAERALASTMVPEGLGKAFGEDKTPVERGLGALEAGLGGLGVAAKIQRPGSIKVRPSEAEIIDPGPVAPTNRLPWPKDTPPTAGTPDTPPPFTEGSFTEKPKFTSQRRAVKTPNYYTQSGEHTPNFANDVDHAMWMVSELRPSKMHSEYLKFVQETTGLDAKRAHQMSVEFAKYAKSLMKNTGPGTADIPETYGSKDWNQDPAGEASISPMGESIVPSERPEEPSFARIGENEYKMDIGDPREMIEIFRNTYHGSVAQIATKELLQNAIDATRALGVNGKVEVSLNEDDPTNRVIKVSDNGPGLTKKEIETVYTNLSSSGKRGMGQGDIGEMGVGKATYLITGKNVTIDTVVRESDGKLHGYSFGGSPEDIMTGFQINEFDPGPDATTGTTVYLDLEQGEEFEGVKNYLHHFKNYSNSPVNVKVTGANKYVMEGPMKNWGNRDVGDITPFQMKEGKIIHQGELPETRYKITIPENAQWVEADRIPLILSARGMMQGVDTFFAGKNLLPDRILIDLDPKVKATDKGYPLTAPTRERLKDDSRWKLQAVIKEHLIDKLNKNRQEEMGRIFDALSPLTKDSFIFYDDGKRYTPQELHNLATSPSLIGINRVLNNFVQDLSKAVPEFMQGKNIRKVGLFASAARGVNIKHPLKEDYALLFNPFSIINSVKNPSLIGDAFVHVAMHEFNHMYVRSEGKDYTASLADLYARFPLSEQAAYAKLINGSILNWDKSRYNAEIPQLLQQYTESRGRTETSPDILLREAGSIVASEGGPTQNDVSNQADGGGIINRLLSDESGAVPISNERWVPRTRREWYEFSRGIVASGDIAGAAFRQGKWHFGSKEWLSSIKPMLESAVSQRKYDLYDDYINSLPVVRDGIAHQMGVRFSDMSANPHTREAYARSQLAENIPGGIGAIIKGSNRAYTMFLNILRANVAQRMYDYASDAEKIDPYHLRKIGQFINDTTGKGKYEYGVDLGKHTGRRIGLNIGGSGSRGIKTPRTTLNLDEHRNFFNDFFFSGGNTMSNIRMLNPGTYIFLPKQVRNQYLVSLLRGIAAISASTYLLNKLVPESKVKTDDPTNADWMKVRRGNVRFDAGGGASQIITLLMRLYEGGLTSSVSGKALELGKGYKAYTRKDILENFAFMRSHPYIKFAYDLAHASEYKPFNITDRTIQLFMPMMLGDLLEIQKEHPDLLPVAGATVGAMGMGTNIYEGGPEKSLYTPRIARALGLKNPDKFGIEFKGGPLGGRFLPHKERR